jgi:hypothetical protein
MGWMSEAFCKFQKPEKLLFVKLSEREIKSILIYMTWERKSTFK